MARITRIGPATTGMAMTIPPTVGPHRRAASVARTTSAGASVIFRSHSANPRILSADGGRARSAAPEDARPERDDGQHEAQCEQPHGWLVAARGECHAA